MMLKSKSNTNKKKHQTNGYKHIKIDNKHLTNLKDHSGAM